MKKLLSIFLSTSLLFITTSQCSYARTAWNDRSFINSAQNQKPISIIKQNNGEKVILQGDETPTIVINNKSESHSSARAFSGGSSWTKIIMFLIKVAVLTLGARFAWNKLKILSGNLTDIFSTGFTSLKDFVASLPIFNQNTTNIEKSIENENSKRSLWDSFLNFFRGSSQKNEDHDLPTSIPTPAPSAQPYMSGDSSVFLGNVFPIGGSFFGSSL